MCRNWTGKFLECFFFLVIQQRSLVHSLSLLRSLQMLATVVVLRTGKMLGVISFPDLDLSIPHKVRSDWVLAETTERMSKIRSLCEVFGVPPRCSRCLCCMLEIKYQDCLGHNDWSRSWSTTVSFIRKVFHLIWTQHFPSFQFTHVHSSAEIQYFSDYGVWGTPAKVSLSSLLC